MFAASWGSLAARQILACFASLVLMAGMRCEPIRSSTEGSSFRFVEVDGSLGLWEGDRPVLVYRHGLQRKPGVPEDRWRSCYIHPLYGLDGEILTDDFPPDHLHHRGLFWAWPHVRVDDREFDLWMMQGIRQQFERWTAREVKDGRASLGVETGWFVEDRRVVREVATITVQPASESERLMELELNWSAVDEAVTIWGAEGKSYGGLSLRFAPRQDTVITTPNGRDKRDLNLAPLPWADLAATFRDARGPSGVAIFVDSNHPGFPPHWITRHYGFLGVGWPGVHPAVLRPGETTSCNYRMLIHRGFLDQLQLQQAYDKFAHSR